MRGACWRARLVRDPMRCRRTSVHRSAGLGARDVVCEEFRCRRRAVAGPFGGPFSVAVRSDAGGSPTPCRAAVRGDSVVLGFEDPLDDAWAPARSAFKVVVTPARGAPAIRALAERDPVAVRDGQVTLKLASPLLATDVVTVEYAETAGHVLRTR